MNPITADLPALHGFFTREGGLSTGPYATMNCSLSGADDRATVLQNRALVAAHMGVAPSHLLGVRQVHGTQVETVTSPWQPGDGPTADAMVTTLPNIALGIITADCAPVLFADRGGQVIGAAHAGWRGALSGILEATVAAMQNLGAAEIRAAIGPCIHQRSYEVTASLRDPILAQDPTAETFFAPGREQHWHFDLPAYCRHRLAKLNIPAEILPHDTCADEAHFFSHRRRTLRGEAAIGHQISVIRI